MKKLTTPALSLLLIGLASPAAASDGDRSHFKCFVEAADGSEHVIYISTWTMDEVLEAAAAKQIRVQDNERQPVRRVMECLPKDDSFSDPAARRIEQETPT